MAVTIGPFMTASTPRRPAAAPAAAAAGVPASVRMRRRRLAALVAPPLLLVSTYLAFQGLSAWLGDRWGYLAGFGFFWLVWCAGFPLWAIGPRGIATVLRDAVPRLPRPTALWLALLAIPVAGGFATVLLPSLSRATLAVLALAWLIAIVNATLEELLWRGVYIRLFPDQLVAGWLYPAIMFSIWHLSPTSVHGSTSVLLAGAAYLGLLYGWIAHRTASIRVTILAHVLVNAMGINFALLILGR